MFAGNVAPPNVSVPEYLSPPIPQTLATPIKPLSFLPLCLPPQQNRPFILFLSFQFQPVTTKLTKSNLHRTSDAGSAYESLSSSRNTSTNLGGLNPRASGPVPYSKNILIFKSANFSWIFKPSGTEANRIDSQILKDQMALTTQVREFQEDVRTYMQRKYSRNHNIVTFQLSEIVTLCIPKEDRVNTDNHKLICIVKDISHDGRHLPKTQFGVLDRLYPTGELNVVPEVDQKALRSEFKNSLSKAITLHTVAAKVGTSHKVAVSCTCNKTCSPKSRCKCQKLKLK